MRTNPREFAVDAIVAGGAGGERGHDLGGGVGDELHVGVGEEPGRLSSRTIL